MAYQKLWFKVLLGAIFAWMPLHAAENDTKSPWTFEAGASIGAPAPLTVVAGVGYGPIFFHAQGFGLKTERYNYWCGMRGSLAYRFFRNHPTNIDLGAGVGYFYGEAPNEIHQALNQANGAMYLYNYNFEETLDLSIEATMRVGGIFLQMDLPLHNFRGNTDPNLIWRLGYLFRI